MNVLRALIFTALLGACPVAATAQDDAPQITVTGDGEVLVAPDQAVVSMGVTQEARTAAEAMNAMSADLTRVIAGLRAAGVAERDIRTSGLNLSPQRDYSTSSGEPRIDGYLASSMVTVTVRDLETLGGLLDAVTQDGANEMRGLQFDVADRKPHLDAARRLAVADARHKAEVLAEAAGVTLGPIRMIQEGQAAGRPMPMMDMARAESMAVPVAEGELSISASVLMVFEVVVEE